MAASKEVCLPPKSKEDIALSPQVSLPIPLHDCLAPSKDPHLSLCVNCGLLKKYNICAECGFSSNAEEDETVLLESDHLCRELEVDFDAQDTTQAKWDFFRLH